MTENDIPSRIQYAIDQFEKHNIEYVLKNEVTGHFHCRRKSDDKLFQFYAGTGKIVGCDKKRGIHSLIAILDTPTTYCPSCKHFVWCESPKQFFHASTGTPCKDFERGEKE